VNQRYTKASLVKRLVCGKNDGFAGTRKLVKSFETAGPPCHMVDEKYKELKVSKISKLIVI
jgi:hypothetical protein